MEPIVNPQQQIGSDGLQNIFASMHYPPRDGLKSLEPSDLVIIRQIANGKLTATSRGERIKAIRLMADLGRKQDSKIMSAILDDEGEEYSARLAAAACLGFFTAKNAEPILIGHLNIKDDLIRVKIIKSLGMLGGTDAYDALAGLQDIQTDFVQKQLTFAKALIAYRNNLDADPLPFIEGAGHHQGSKDELLQLLVKLVSARTIGVALKRFQGSNYGLTLARSTGFEVTAGKARWMLFINKQSAEEGIIKSINSRKMIIGLLSRWIEVGGAYDTQYVILTKPFENEVQIMVVRSDGEMSYSGKASVKGEDLSFLVSDIKRPGTAPTNAVGKLTENGIEWEITIPFSKRKDKRSPRAIEAEEIYNKFSNRLL